MAINHGFNMNATALTKIWNFPKLKGQENYQPWSKKMKKALKCCGLWDIVDNRAIGYPEELPKEQAVAEQLADGTVRQSIPVTGPSNEQVQARQVQLKAWQNLNNQAGELIYSMCEEMPSEAIEDEDIAMNRWIKLRTDYSDSGIVLRHTKLQELWTTSLSSSNGSIKTYVANIRTKSEDLKRMGAPIDGWILVASLLNNLDGKYKDFFHHLITQLDDNPEFDKIVTLLHQEDRRLKRVNKDQAMAASMKKHNKEQEERKASRGNSSNHRRRNSSGRGRGGHNNNGSDRPSKNPNSTNYKGDGDTPECSKSQPLASGNKKRHWPFDCWTLHEKKMPEKYRNNNNNTSKPKANAAKDRPDDFEDVSQRWPI